MQRVGPVCGVANVLFEVPQGRRSRERHRRRKENHIKLLTGATVVAEDTGLK
jgi:hypothetical protein